MLWKPASHRHYGGDDSKHQIGYSQCFDHLKKGISYAEEKTTSTTTLKHVPQVNSA